MFARTELRSERMLFLSSNGDQSVLGSEDSIVTSVSRSRGVAASNGYKAAWKERFLGDKSSMEGGMGSGA
jgi:hypothetical protein